MSSVTAKIKRLNEKYLYSHCYKHNHNLAVGDMMSNKRNLGNMLDIMSEMCKLVKNSLPL